MIQLSALTKSFGDRVLFEKVTWQISPGERVGLCGPNGAGKTTLLKMLASLEDVDSGAIIKPAGMTAAYLPQDGLTHAGRSVFEEASTAFQPLLSIKAEMHEIEASLGDAALPQEEHDALLDRYSDLQDRFRLGEGYNIDLRVAAVLRGLGFAETSFAQPTESLSGGWQMRLALAKFLLGRPDLLLLDEPTNHLDLDARNWLESYLCSYPHAVILVSHDRFFLDAVVTRIADLTLRNLTDYPGGYSHYIVERDARMDRLRAAKRQQESEIARVRQFIDRFRYQATKAAQVQSRLKMLEKVVPIEAPPERKRIHFTFPACAKSGRSVFELRGARKAYGPLVVFGNVNLLVERGDRIAVIGPNGAGKSTLMRMLAGAEAPDAGIRHDGHQVVMQYFAQDEATQLDPKPTVYETLAAGSPDQMVPAIRNILGGFLFSGDDIYKRVAVLSGGERTRLAVARMLLRPSNTLLLDEPTNHLDLDSKDVLLEALEDYGGTLIFVSHDRYFVERLANKIVKVGDGEAVVFPGTYDEFLWSTEHADEARSAERTAPSSPRTGSRSAPPAGSGSASRTASRSAPRRAAAAVAPGPDPPPGAAPDGAAGHQARKRERSGQRRREQDASRWQTRVAELESRIADREQAIKNIEATMAAPGFYEDRDAAQPLIDRHQALMWEVRDLIHQWEELQSAPPAATETAPR